MTAPPAEPDHPPAEPDHPPDNLERDSRLAHERTSLAWTRTALSFAVLGGTVLKVNVFPGLVILAVAPVVWHLGRVTRGRASGPDWPAVGATRLFMIAASVVVVSLICLAVVIFGQAVPGALR